MQAAKRITEALFLGDIQGLTEEDCQQLELDGLPSSVLHNIGDQPLTTLFVEAGLAKNGSQAKDALKRNAVVVNGVDLGLEQNMQAAQVFNESKALQGKYFIVRLGKKSYHLFKL